MEEIENNKTPHCSGNCMKCNPFQRAYCSSQLSYSNMRMLEQMEQQVEKMQNQMVTIAEKIESMQNNEATLIYPTSESKEEKSEIPTLQTAQ